ncbi:hypothetical protein AB0M45_28660 [Nocardia sp. NPDC051787]|uniref:hypothetical protein n=1 Tax=Nocardia sp. NPDC051787 TaxID=3155415 RepID=UPI0034238898
MGVRSPLISLSGRCGRMLLARAAPLCGAYGIVRHAMPTLMPLPTVIAGVLTAAVPCVMEVPGVVEGPCVAEMVCCPVAVGVQVVVAWLLVTCAGFGEKVPAALSVNVTGSEDEALSIMAVTRYSQLVP